MSARKLAQIQAELAKADRRRRETAGEAARVMLHFSRGGEVLFRDRKGREFAPCLAPVWNWRRFQYIEA